MEGGQRGESHCEWSSFGVSRKKSFQNKEMRPVRDCNCMRGVVVAITYLNVKMGLAACGLPTFPCFFISLRNLTYGV